MNDVIKSEEESIYFNLILKNVTICEKYRTSHEFDRKKRERLKMFV